MPTLAKPKRPSPSDKPVGPDAARKLILSGKAPANLRVSGTLKFTRADNLTALPDGLSVGTLVLCECDVGSSRVDLQACKLEYSIVSPK